MLTNTQKPEDLKNEEFDSQFMTHLCGYIQIVIILNPYQRQQSSSTATIVESKQAFDQFNVLPSHSGKSLED